MHTVKNAKINSICLQEQSIEWLEPVANDHNSNQPGHHRYDDDKGPVAGAGHLRHDSVFRPLLDTLAVPGLCSRFDQNPGARSVWPVVSA